MGDAINTAGLKGVRVLTCRQAGRDGELHDRIRSAGATVVQLRLIEVIPPDDAGEDLRDALSHLSSCDWLACTSANGVAAVADCLAPRGASLPATMRIAAVGPATASAFEEYFDRTPDLVPERATGANLGASFPPGPGSVIAPLAALASEDLAVALRAKGYDVRVAVAYATVSPTPTPNEIADAQSADVAVLTSPSAVDRLVAHLGSPLSMPIVAIGPRSAAAAARVAAKPVVEAADTSAGAMFDAIVRALR